jgi:hypothetical protein
MIPIDLETLATSAGYRVALDPSSEIDTARSERPWLIRIPARYGFISVHGTELLACYCSARRLFTSLMAIPSVRVLQRGDDEIRVIFEPGHLGDVCEIIRARKRRVATDAQRRHLATIGASSRFSRHS